MMMMVFEQDLRLNFGSDALEHALQIFNFLSFLFIYVIEVAVGLQKMKSQVVKKMHGILSVSFYGQSISFVGWHRGEWDQVVNFAISS